MNIGYTKLVLSRALFPAARVPISSSAVKALRSRLPSIRRPRTRNTFRVALAALAICFGGGRAPAQGITSTCPIADCSNWMHELKSQIGNFPLNYLAIPGTHDSGTYSLQPNSPPSPDSALFTFYNSALATLNTPALSPLVPTFKRLFDQILEEGITYPWALAQNPAHNLTVQLNAGIRYFDIRTCKDSSGELRVCHSLFGTTIFDLLHQVAVWSRSHTDEIVILDFNHLDPQHGLSSADLYDLGGGILSTFTETNPYDMLVPSQFIGPTSTLNQIWNYSKTARIIVLMDDPTEVQVTAPYIWPGQVPTQDGPTIDTPWPAQSSAAGQLQKETAIFSCRCNPGSTGPYNDLSTLFVLQTNPTPDQNVIFGAIVSAIEAKATYTIPIINVSVCIPGFCDAINALAKSEGWILNSPGSLRSLDDQANGNNYGSNPPLLTKLLMQNPPINDAIQVRNLLNIVQADWFDEQHIPGTTQTVPSNFVAEMIKLNTPPQTTLSVGVPQYPAANNQLFVTSQTPFTIHSTETYWTVTYLMYSYGHYGTQIYAPSGSFTVGNSTVPQADGPYTVTTYARDNVDLLSNPNTLPVILDNTPPVITISAPANGANYAKGGNALLSYGVSDGGGSGVKAVTAALLDGRPAPATGQLFTPALTPGPHTFTYGPATDNLGNVAPAQTVTFTVIAN
jgi:hypothetical protein